MSISSSNRKAGPFACNGATVAFPFSFKVFTTADVRVVLTDSIGVESDLALGTNYTVALNADQDANPGGTVTTTATYATGYKVTLTSQVQNLQPVTLTNQGGFYPKVITNALDRLTILVQQAVQSVKRSMVMPLSSDLDSFVMTEGATAASRADKVIGFDAAGNPVLKDAADNNQLRLDLSASSGSSRVGHIDIGANAVVRTAQDALRDVKNIKAVGAAVDGSSNDAVAVGEMASDYGYIRFPSGVTRIGTNITISSPVYFDDAASLLIDPGITVTFSECIISAPRQHIFSGAGSVALTGERTVSVCAEWFGVLPNDSSGDLAANTNKLFAACPSGQECVISFGPGSFYYSTAPNNVPRAVRIIGSGERVTNFVFMGGLSGAGDFFTTAGEGVWFEHMQFTCTGGSSRRSNGNLIKLNHQYCKVRNIWFTDSFGGVDVAQNYCEVDGVVAFRNASTAGSHLVKLSSGFGGSRVRNVQYNDSTPGLGPEYAVRIEAHTNFIVDSVTTAGAGTAVGVVPSSGSCSGGQFDNISARGATGVNGVLISSTGTAAVEKLHFGKVIADGLTGVGFKMQKDGSGIMKYIEIASVESRACTGGGFAVNSTSGYIDHWHLKGGFCRNGAANGYDIANSRYWTISGCESISNTGTGTLIANTCANFIYTNNRNVFNLIAQLTDNSGSVTKVIANNI